MSLERMKPYLAGLGFSSIFGFSFMFTKGALERIDAYRLIAFRFALAAVLITLLAALKVLKVDLRGKSLRPLLLVALLQPILYFICETNGLALTSSSQTGMMIALIPIVVTLLSVVCLGERPLSGQVATIMLSVGGVLFIGWQQGSAGLAAGWKGPLVLLGAVLAAAFFNILARRSSGQFQPAEITLVMMWVGAIFFNLLALLLHWQAGDLSGYLQPWRDQQVLVALLYLGAGSSVGGFLLINYSLSRLPASQSAVFSNLTTVISIAAGVIWRHEPFHWYHAVGAAAILLGVYGTNYLGFRQRQRQQATRVAAS